jgi:membrane-bound inhibitor of C-type lysozyme
MIKPALVIATLLLAAGCATTDVPTGETYVWRCDGGITFTARNTTGGNAEVVAGGQTYRLPGVIAASGVRYSDGRVEYWEHHGEATLTGAAGGPYANCRS